MLETAWESRWLPDSLGGLAQLGERLPCKQEVTSSNLVFSTLVYSVVALLLHYFCVFDKFIYVLYNTLNRKVGR